MNQKPQSWLTTLTFALLGSGGITFFSSREEGIARSELILTALVGFSVLFVTLRISDRMTRAVLGRYGPKPKPAPERGAPVTEASTDRPSHVARRRQQRRPRGGPRKR